MAWAKAVRQCVLQLRKKHMSLPNICARIAVPRRTIAYWIRNVPLGRPPDRARLQRSQRLAVEGMQAKYAAIRNEAYGSIDPGLLNDPLIRDFAVMYLGEGYRRCRNVVNICNSNPNIMRMAIKALHKLGFKNRLSFKLLLYPDHKDLDKKRFWARRLKIQSAQIKVWRPAKKQKPSKYRRSEHGIMYMTVNDTYLRAQLQALMDTVEASWK